MSMRPGQGGVPTSEEEMQRFYQSMPPQWTGVDTPPFQNSYIDPNQAYCSENLGHPNIHTPISLPDSSFHPSPVLGHPSQEFHPPPHPEYRYINDPVLQQGQGLGISAPFPSEYPRTTAPNAVNYAYATHGHLHHGLLLGQTPSLSPQAPPPKRTKRAHSKPPSRDNPINILPHPEGMERMERDRERRTGQGSPPTMPLRPRAPGRSRRDPQAEEEDDFVDNLRDHGVPWKEICDRFGERFNKDASQAKLQMRRNRRKKRWEDADVQMLIKAHEAWEQEKYQLIADKLKELGCTKGYTAKQCKEKLLRLQTLEEKQALDEGEQGSPSSASEPPSSPSASVPSTSRKRRRDSPEA